MRKNLLMASVMTLALSGVGNADNSLWYALVEGGARCVLLDDMVREMAPTLAAKVYVSTPDQIATVMRKIADFDMSDRQENSDGSIISFKMENNQPKIRAYFIKGKSLCERKSKWFMEQ
jgi:hypothetical protein